MIEGWGSERDCARWCEEVGDDHEYHHDARCDDGKGDPRAPPFPNPDSVRDYTIVPSLDALQEHTLSRRQLRAERCMGGESSARASPAARASASSIARRRDVER